MDAREPVDGRTDRVSVVHCLQPHVEACLRHSRCVQVWNSGGEGFTLLKAVGVRYTTLTLFFRTGEHAKAAQRPSDALGCGSVTALEQIQGDLPNSLPSEPQRLPSSDCWALDHENWYQAICSGPVRSWQYQTVVCESSADCTRGPRRDSHQHKGWCMEKQL